MVNLAEGECPVVLVLWGSLEGNISCPGIVVRRIVYQRLGLRVTVLG